MRFATLATPAALATFATFATFAALLTLAPAAASAAGNDFSGAWVSWLCPAGVSRDSGQCSNFVLELHQRGERLCGAHMYSTAGASQLDEGAAPSVSGGIEGGTASIVTVSGRSVPPVRVKAELKFVNGMLHWQRLEDPAGDYLLPASARMIRSKRKTLFAPVFEHELRAACVSLFTMVEEEERARQAPAPAEAQATEAPADPAGRP